MPLTQSNWTIYNEGGTLVTVWISHGADFLTRSEEEDRCLNIVLCAGTKREDISRSGGVEQSVETICQSVQRIFWFTIISRMQNGTVSSRPCQQSSCEAVKGATTVKIIYGRAQRVSGGGT